jgi:hypothetical protein
MYVTLVVTLPEKYDDRPILCCGGENIRIIRDEWLVGDDPKHFPNLKPKANIEAEDYLSIPYLAAVLIGSTGWSGFNESKGEYFKAAYSDLSATGVALWDMLQDLYPTCKLELLTWLDT